MNVVVEEKKITASAWSRIAFVQFAARHFMELNRLTIVLLQSRNSSDGAGGVVVVLLVVIVVG